MLQSQEQRSRPTTIVDLHRLAAAARERGLRVFEAAPNQWFCTSFTDAFKLHVVTGFSCDCLGFINHGRCTHHSLFLEHLGWLPELPEDALGVVTTVTTPPATKPCFWCNGTGRQVGIDGYDRCQDCNGTGRKPDRRPQGEPAVQPVAQPAAA